MEQVHSASDSKSKLKCIEEKLADTRPYHGAVRIDRLAVAAVALASADGTVKPVFSEDPHRLLSSRTYFDSSLGLF